MSASERLKRLDDRTTYEGSFPEKWEQARKRGLKIAAALPQIVAVVEATEQVLRVCDRTSSRDPSLKRDAGRKRKAAYDALAALEEALA